MLPKGTFDVSASSRSPAVARDSARRLVSSLRGARGDGRNPESQRQSIANRGVEAISAIGGKAIDAAARRARREGGRSGIRRDRIATPVRSTCSSTTRPATFRHPRRTCRRTASAPSYRSTSRARSTARASSRARDREHADRARSSTSARRRFTAAARACARRGGQGRSAQPDLLAGGRMGALRYPRQRAACRVLPAHDDLPREVFDANVGVSGGMNHARATPRQTARVCRGRRPTCARRSR